jgi:hypothetical protein
MDKALVQKSQINPITGRPYQVYDQQPGESDLWYRRFIKFRDYGVDRDLLQCYLEVMWQRDAQLRAAQHQNPSGSGIDRETSMVTRPRRSYLPASWIRQVTKFDWWGRAAEWDADQHQRALQRCEAVIDQAREVAPEMVQILIDLARGDVSDEKTEKFMRERRLSACELLKLAGVDLSDLQIDEDDGEIQVVGITIHRSGE